MKIIYAALALILSLSIASAADKLADKWQKRINDAESAYSFAIQKADNARFFAAQKANGDRLKVLKAAMSDATKLGDLEAATTIRDLVKIAELDGVGKPRPKNVVKFAGHDYALIEDKVTWHVAKRRCEEMGGHLATVETSTEASGLLSMCVSAKTNAWFGASDEEHEGDWKWVTGQKVQLEFRRDNSGDAEHYLGCYGGSWEDLGDARFSFVCEWES